MKTLVFDEPQECCITKAELWRGAVTHLLSGAFRSAMLCLKSSLKARWR
jgi:hypothetical protein